jgi:methylmalonyl-CoA mutase C-terminal domain/subunit
MIVNAAVQEDVDAIGLSSLSGAHMTLFAKVLELLKQQRAESILLFGGGVMPEADAKKLNEQGIGRLFGPGTDTNEIVSYLRREVPKRREKSEV